MELIGVLRAGIAAMGAVYAADVWFQARHDRPLPTDDHDVHITARLRRRNTGGIAIVQIIATSLGVIHASGRPFWDELGLGSMAMSGILLYLSIKSQRDRERIRVWAARRDKRAMDRLFYAVDGPHSCTHAHDCVHAAWCPYARPQHTETD